LTTILHLTWCDEKGFADMSGNSPRYQPVVEPGVRGPVPPDPSEVSSMHGVVVEELGSGIASGRLAGILDLDRIARHFQVSRSLVRECLRTLAAKGMVRARQRTGTSVTSPEQWAVLDEQVIRWRAAGPQRFLQMRESLQIRQRVEPLAARLMAEHHSPAQLERLQRATEWIARAIARSSGQEMIEADTSYHRELYLGSGNTMLGRLAGTVHACLRVPDFQGYGRFSVDTVTRHQRLTALIADRDADGAEEAAEHLMTLTKTLFLAAYQQVMEQRPRDRRGQPQVRT
jgi:DNA-binding FadR family transcriptional regulator